MIRTLFFILSVFTLLACNQSPKPIAYGSEACHFCKMTIVDNRHASQVMSEKGKTYSFDAIECMIHSLRGDLKDKPMALYRVSNFNSGGAFIDAATATFLISPELPSPMGANLSAFENKEAAEKAMNGFSGQLFSWQAIQEHVNQ